MQREVRGSVTLASAALVGLGAVLAALATGCGDEGQTCSEEPGIICTWAGNGEAAFDGDGNALRESSFYWPVDVTFSAGGTFIVDWNNHRIRRVQSDDTLTTVMGTDFVGDGPDDLSDLTMPGAEGTTIHLNHPTQFVPLPNGKYIAVSWHNHKLRTWDPGTGRAVVTCGGPAGFKGDGGPLREARLDQPQNVVLDGQGGMYILDQRNQVIRYVNSDDIISTVVGTVNEPGFEGDDGPPLQAKMSQPDGSNPPPGGGIALDGQGRLYFSDTLNHRVRRVDFAANRIETVAGNGEAAYGGDGGDGVQASLNNPRKLTMGPDGRLYIGDEFNNRIRALDLDTGVITTVAGDGTGEYAGDGEEATSASLYHPVGVTFDGGFMYVLDTYNHRIRRVKL